jgi:hypothetical protein
MKYEKKKGKTRVRLLLGLRKVVLGVVIGLLTLLPSAGSWGVDSWELDNAAPQNPSRDQNDSWELDWNDPKAVEGDDRFGGGRDRTPREELPRVFVRGDVNSDANVDVADSVALLRHLYLSDLIDCDDAADVDDSGAIDPRDSVELLSYLFVSQASTVSTLGSGPVSDETPDGLGCEVSMEFDEADASEDAAAVPVEQIEQTDHGADEPEVPAGT